jgi:hypothetical protein
MEIPAQGQGRAVYSGPGLTAQNSTRAGEDRDGRACVFLAGALEIAAGPNLRGWRLLREILFA